MSWWRWPGASSWRPGRGSRISFRSSSNAPQATDRTVGSVSIRASVRDVARHQVLDVRPAADRNRVRAEGERPAVVREGHMAPLRSSDPVRARADRDLVDHVGGVEVVRPGLMKVLITAGPPGGASPMMLPTDPSSKTDSKPWRRQVPTNSDRSCMGRTSAREVLRRRRDARPRTTAREVYGKYRHPVAACDCPGTRSPPNLDGRRTQGGPRPGQGPRWRRRSRLRHRCPGAAGRASAAATRRPARGAPSPPARSSDAP